MHPAEVRETYEQQRQRGASRLGRDKKSLPFGQSDDNEAPHRRGEQDRGDVDEADTGRAEGSRELLLEFMVPKRPKAPAAGDSPEYSREDRHASGPKSDRSISAHRGEG